MLWITLFHPWLSWRWVSPAKSTAKSREGDSELSLLQEAQDMFEKVLFGNYKVVLYRTESSSIFGWRPLYILYSSIQSLTCCFNIRLSSNFLQRFTDTNKVQQWVWEEGQDIQYSTYGTDNWETTRRENLIVLTQCCLYNIIWASRRTLVEKMLLQQSYHGL